MSTQGLLQADTTAQVTAVFNAINNYRASRGLALVKYHRTVAGLAQDWSNNIASRETIEHRANFWTDPRALSPNNGAGEVIAVRWDRDAAQLVEWWKGSPAHNAILTDPRFNVVGIGITLTDGNWQTSPNRYTMWGVVNFFGYTFLPSGTITAPDTGVSPPAPIPSVCDPAVKHMPPTRDLRAAAIKSGSDLLAINPAGQLLDIPWLGNSSYGTPTVIGGGFSTAKEIFLTDWERDGVFDVLAQWNDGRLTLHPGRASGDFGPSVTLGQTGWAAMSIAVGQWCANNRLPQIVALDSSGSLWLYPNSGYGSLVQRTPMSSGVSGNRISMVDYDADGFQDIVARQQDGKVLLYRGAGTATPVAEMRTTVAVGWSDVTAIRAIRDVTGLNSTGVVVRRTGDIVQYLGLSGASFAPPWSIPGNWAGIRLGQ